MKITSICVGNVKKITSIKKFCCGKIETINGLANKVKYEITAEDYKKNAVLIKLGDNKYIDIDNINNVWNFILLCTNLIKSKDIVTETLLFHYASLGELFIDAENSEFYDLYEQIGLLKLKQLVKDKKLDKIIVKKYN